MTHIDDDRSADRARPQGADEAVGEDSAAPTVWVRPVDVDVDSPFEGRIVRSTRPLSDWCLRRDDGSDPIPTGTTLEIVETRPHGAMARELSPPGDLLKAALDLQADGLFEVGS